MKKRKSFAKQLMKDIVLIATLVLVLGFALVAVTSHKLITKEATKSAQHLLDATISDIEKEIQIVENGAINAVWIVEEHLDDTNYLYHITERLVSQSPITIGSTIAFRSNYFEGKHFFSPYSYEDPVDGIVKSKQLGTPSYDYFQKEFYLLPIELGQPCWTEPYFDEGGGERQMATFCYPIRDAQGDIFAILTADIGLDWIEERISAIHPYDDSFMLLRSKEGLLIGNEDLAKQSDELAVLTTNMANEPEGLCQFKMDGEYHFGIFGRLSNGWSAALVCQYREVLARNIQMNVYLFLIGLLAVTALFITCYLIIKQLTKPITDFSKAAESIAKGDFNTPLPEITSENEIKQLRDSFDDMQHSLAKMEETTKANARMASELNIARHIQEGLLSHNYPCNETAELYALLRPAKEVGGDLYDFDLRNNKLYFAVGDVSGKSVPAAIFMAITRCALHFFSGLGLPISEVVSKINNTFCENNNSQMFVTLLLGRLDLSTGQLDYCNAGHNRAIIIDSKGQVSFLDQKPNIAVGVFPGFKYEQQAITLEEGTRLVIYTDGITEAERNDKAQFGDENLKHWAEQAASTNLSAEQAANDLLETVQQFTEGNEQNDDITIMTINYKKK